MVLDRAHFDHMTGGDRALQAEVVALFLGQASDLRAACDGQDWRAAVHTLKGSARGIGLVALADACAAAEQAVEGARAAALDRVRAALAEALLELERFASPQA